jgi:hypothetical protein
MNHLASRESWDCYHALPEAVRDLADKDFALLRENPSHPSLQFKKVGRFGAARVGMHYGALGVASGENLVWFWIGAHTRYDPLWGGVGPVVDSLGYGSSEEKSR